MVKIHWSVYLILGIGVLLTSYNLDTQKFQLFIWTGYIFLTVGIAKMVFWFITRVKESPVEKNEIRRELHQTRSHQKFERYCMKCGNPLGGHEIFCPKCGQRQRHKF
jgi:hypothetical protein